MTKQHFIALADHIRAINHEFSTLQFTTRQVEYLADFCQSQNPQFNRSRWLAYVKGECRPNGGSIKKEKVTA